MSYLEVFGPLTGVGVDVSKFFGVGAGGVNPLTSYVPNSSHPTFCSFILHTVVFIAQRPVSRIRPESHFLFKRFIAI